MLKGIVERMELLGRIRALESLVFELHPAPEEQLHAHMKEEMASFVQRMLESWEDLHPGLAAKLASMRSDEVQG